MGIFIFWLRFGAGDLGYDVLTKLDESPFRAIEAATNVSLVIQGGFGVSMEQRKSAAATSAICKFNIGTALRQTLGRSLRIALEVKSDLFDRIAFLKSTEADVETAVRTMTRALGASTLACWLTISHAALGSAVRPSSWLYAAIQAIERDAIASFRR